MPTPRRMNPLSTPGHRGVLGRLPPPLPSSATCELEEAATVPSAAAEAADVRLPDSTSGPREVLGPHPVPLAPHERPLVGVPARLRQRPAAVPEGKRGGGNGWGS